MDPVACLNEMRGAVKDQDWALAKERAYDLKAWIDRGGFWPDGITPADLCNELHDTIMRASFFDLEGV